MSCVYGSFLLWRLCITFFSSSYNILGGYVYEAENLYGADSDSTTGGCGAALDDYHAAAQQNESDL